MVVETRRRSAFVAKTPAAKSEAKSKKKEKYGQAIFKHKARGTRKGEATKKVTREEKMVESPFRAEVPERINLLRGLKKMIQKKVTGAEAKRCPGQQSKCKPEEMVKGPYLVSLATVEKLAKIIKLTPHDASDGRRMKALMQHRADYLDMKKERKQLINNLLAKSTNSRKAYLSAHMVKTFNSKKGETRQRKLRPGSKTLAGKAVVKLEERKVAAAKKKKTKANNKAEKNATQTKKLERLISADNSSSYANLNRP